LRVRLILISMLLLASGFALSQRGHHDPTPQDRDANPERQFAVQHPDASQIRREAAELAQLAATIPPDVSQATQGILPKDLKDRLKKIEKLSKRLRSELMLD